MVIIHSYICYIVYQRILVSVSCFSFRDQSLAKVTGNRTPTIHHEIDYQMKMLKQPKIHVLRETKLVEGNSLQLQLAIINP